MSKKILPQKPAATQTIRLDQISITFYRHPCYLREEGLVAVTVTGREIAALLNWAALRRPSEPLKDFALPACTGYTISGIAETLRALGTVDVREYETGKIFGALGEFCEDLANRFEAEDYAEETLQKAFITVNAGEQGGAGK